MVLESNTLDYLFLQDGSDGLPGAPGKDGAVTYTWWKYSQDPSGANMTDDSTNAKYIGLAFNKTSPIESDNPLDYNWSLIRGQDGANGADGYTIILSNENISFATNPSRIPTSSQSYTCDVMVMKGADPYNDFTIGELTKVSGITSSVSGHTITLSVSSNTAISNDNGSINVPITIDENTVIKTISYSLSKAGASGSAGTSVTSVDVLYYLSNSSSILSGGSWQSEAPQWEDGKYIWSKTVTTLSDKSTSETNPVCITGGKGQDGESITVASSSITYQVSTSGTTPPTGNWSTTIPSTADGQYLWTKTSVTYSDDTSTTSYSVSKIGKDGSDGEDGRGISGTAITYQSSSSGTTIPTGNWVSSIPAVPDGQYLWTRTITTYTDSSTSISYSVGKMGNTGATGTGVESITEEYAISTSKTTPPQTGWSSTAPEWSKGHYIWTRSKIVYKNPTSTEYTAPICDSSWEAANDVQSNLDNAVQTITETISGVSSQVDKNTQSITNKVWQSDVESYVDQYDNTTVKSIRDRVSKTETTLTGITSTVSDITSTVDGMDVKLSSVEQTASKISWLVKNGTSSSDFTITDRLISLTSSALNIDALTTFMNSAKTGSSTVIDGGSIITDSITADKLSVSSLEAIVAKIGGFNITSTSIFSGSKDSATNTTRGLYMDSTGQFSVGDSNNYLKYYKDTDGTYRLAVSASSVVFGTKGENIETVINDVKESAIVSSTEQFYQSTSATSLSGGEWSNSQPTWANGKYIWRRTLVVYGDGHTEYTPSATGVCITGNTGATGATGASGDPGKEGKGISSITCYYLTTSASSGITTSTSGWTTTPTATTTTNKYLWSYEKFSYTDGSTSSTSPHIIGTHGATGATGAAGNGIKSSAVTYQSSSSGTTIPTGTWASSIPSVSAGQYLWTRTVFTYTNGSSTTSYSVGRMGTNGTNGSAGKGVKSTAITYQAGSSQTTAPTGTWSSSVPKTSTSLPYLWTRTIITYTDNSTSTSYSVSSTLDSVEVGGRNLIPNTNNMDNYIMSTGVEISTDDEGYSVASYGTNTEISWIALCTKNNIKYSKIRNKQVTISFEYRSDKWSSTEGTNYPVVTFDIDNTSDTTNNRHKYYTHNVSKPAPTTNWQKYESTLTIKDSLFNSGTEEAIGSDPWVYVRIFKRSLNSMQVRKIKLEYGNKATDWSPAPEDVDTAINDTKNDLSDSIAEVNSNATSLFEQLQDQISMLVTDENGESLMTQNGDGWVFNMSEFIDQLDTTTNNVNTVTDDVTELGSNVNNLVTTVNGLSQLTAYIRIGQENGQPYIELGANNNTFKVRITNTDIKFYDGSTIPAYVSNEALHIGKAEVEDSIKFGGHVLKKRSNGNFGISWEGE